jgi:hypothetical protein
MRISFADLQEAYFFGEGGEVEVFLCKRTGKIYHRCFYDEGNDEEKLPDDIDESDDYLRIPDKREFDLGTPLVFDFVAKFMADDYDEVRRMFGRKGAYGRFKDFLVRKGALQRWYDFSNAAEEVALRAWCEENSIELAD